VNHAIILDHYFYMLGICVALLFGIPVSISCFDNPVPFEGCFAVDAGDQGQT
jgi:hypothetical protein